MGAIVQILVHIVGMCFMVSFTAPYASVMTVKSNLSGLGVRSTEPVQLVQSVVVCTPRRRLVATKIPPSLKLARVQRKGPHMLDRCVSS